MTNLSSITIILHISEKPIDKELEKAFNTAYQRLLDLFDGKEGRPVHGAPIAAFQFAVTYQSEENYHIRTLSIANARYEHLLSEFILDKGSILFSKQKTDTKDTDKEKFQSLRGNEHQIDNTSLTRNNFTPQKETIEARCDFQIWNEYLSGKEFGKCSIWLSLVDKSQEEWRFSIDFFLILNIDIIDNLLKDADFFNNINKDDFYKWKFKYDLFEILYSFANDYGIGIITKALNEALNKQSILSAISQVMARNMSHNIGSHVSYKSTNAAIKHRIIHLYTDWLNEGTTDEKYKEISRNFIITEWIDFMSEKLDKYEIRRNEYLADYSLSPQSFYFYQDVILPFCENTLILDNLAGAEGANYQNQENNRLKLKVFVKRCGDECYSEIKADYPNLTCIYPNTESERTNINYPDYFPYLLKNVDENKSLFNGINSKKILGDDIEVLLHSEQGIYSILENLIRNSAKHNKDSLEKEGLKLRLYLEEQKDRYNLTFSDNVSELEGEKLYNNDALNPGLYQRIKTGVVSTGEQSNKQNLGFADMNINSFLFRFRDSDINGENITKNFQLVEIEGDDCNITAAPITENLEGTHKRKFGYQIELLKPRKVLWIDEEEYLIDGTKKISDLKNEGIFQVYNLNDYLHQADNDQEIAAYDFVVFNKCFKSDQYLIDQNFLPARVLVLRKENEDLLEKPNIRYVDDSFSNFKDADDLLEKCWVQWLNRLPKKTRAFVYYEANIEACEKLEKIKLEGEHSIRCAKSLKTNEAIVDTSNISLIYDHHGYAQSKTHLKIKSDQNFYINHSKIYFDKGSADFGVLSYLSDNELKNKFLAYQLIDAATTNVFVLDERIALTANMAVDRDKDNKTFGIRFSDYDNCNFSELCYGKVFAINHIETKGVEKKIHSEALNYHLSIEIAENRISLKSRYLGNDEEKVNDISELLGGINNINKDILIIHRTYINKEKLGMEVDRFIKLASDTFGSVVITSGGGYPHNLQKKLRFIPFSVVEQCINSRLSKLKLVTYLQKLRYI